MSERWLTKMKNNVMIVVCPHCGHKADYPSDTCDMCHKEVEMPDEQKMTKKMWW